MAQPKKNTAYTFYVTLIDRNARPNLRANPTLAVGDFKVSTDGGAFTNIATAATVEPAAGTSVKIALSAGEMNGDRIAVQGIDAAGAEWDDVFIYIDTTAVTVDDLVRSTTPANTLDVTSGRAAANATQVGSSTIAADRLAISAATMVAGVVDASPSPTTTSFADVTNLTSTVDDHYKGRVVIFTSGTLNKQVTIITGYVGSSHVVTVSPALTSAPVAGVTFIVI